MDYEKIYEALRLIQETCSGNTGVDCCQKCPLGREDGTCHITGRIPENWNIKKPDSVIRLME